jgi:hypothetical protein
MTAPTNQPQPKQPDFSAGGASVKTVDTPVVAEKPKKPRRLTHKQRVFIKEKAKGKTNTEAAMIAYNVKDSTVARSVGAENLAKPSIREALELALEKAGITVEAAVAPIQKALEYKDPDGDERAQLDMRLKGSDRALKLMGAHDSKEPAGGNSFTFIGNNTFVKKEGNS